MKMYSKEGTEMMDIRSIYRDGDNIITKGKMMGAMIASIYLRPKDVWQSLFLLTWSVIWYVPIILWKGFWANRRAKKGLNAE